MLNFAYGSNLYWGQIKERCPSTRFVCVALLRDHRLAFTRKSPSWGCGVADVVPAEEGQAWGVVYEIQDSEIAFLDRAEGYRHGRPLEKNDYVREGRIVYTDGNCDQPLAVSVYFANRQANPPPPSEEYKRRIVEGACYWNLPVDYVDQLEQIRTSFM